MKLSIAMLSVLLMSVAGIQVAHAQSFESQSASIVSAFDSKNATALSEHFCATIELVLPGVDGTFPKAQAKNHIADFFGKQQPRSFELLHQGSRANVSFIVGKLVSATTAFRVNMLFKKEGAQLKIYQLRIE